MPFVNLEVFKLKILDESYKVGVKRRQSIHKGSYARIIMGKESQNKVVKANKNVNIELRNFRFDSQNKVGRATVSKAETEQWSTPSGQNGSSSQSGNYFIYIII